MTVECPPRLLSGPPSNQVFCTFLLVFFALLTHALKPQRLCLSNEDSNLSASRQARQGFRLAKWEDSITAGPLIAKMISPLFIVSSRDFNFREWSNISFSAMTKGGYLGFSLAIPQLRATGKRIYSNPETANTHTISWVPALKISPQNCWQTQQHHPSRSWTSGWQPPTPLLLLCIAVFHHDLPQHEGLVHHIERAALPTFQVMRNIVYIFRFAALQPKYQHWLVLREIGLGSNSQGKFASGLWVAWFAYVIFGKFANF